jgi:hypothetical protein
MRKFLLSIGVLGISFAACEKSNQTTTPPNDTAADTAADTAGAATGDATAGGDTAGAAEGGGDDGTEPGAPGVAWKDKTFKQRQEWMGTTVLPEMKKLFQAHDGAAFGTFKCQTCHGNDMQAKNFKMPNDSIYPLNPKDPIKGAMDYDKKITKFMVDEVTPKMAAMLDEKPMGKDPAGTFGCLRCHPSE